MDLSQTRSRLSSSPLQNKVRHSNIVPERSEEQFLHWLEKNKSVHRTFESVLKIIQTFHNN